MVYQQLSNYYGTNGLKDCRFFIPNTKHFAGKGYTIQIGSLSFKLRNYQVRLNRKIFTTVNPNQY